MNRKKLTDRIFEDWGQKVVCIVLAVIIYVFSQVATLERKVFVLPLKVEADGLMMANSDIPKFVKVSVRTRAENMPSINSGNIFAYINLYILLIILCKIRCFTRIKYGKNLLQM